MQRSSEERQDYVVGMVNRINAVLGGEDMAEACTALTIAVACQIVSTEAGGEKERVKQVRVFASHLEELIRRKDIVEWIKHFTTHVASTGGRH